MPAPPKIVSVSTPLAAKGKEPRTHPNLLPLDHIPINALKPPMVLNIRRPVFQIPQPLAQVRRQQPPNEVLGDKIDVRGEDELARQDLLVDLERRVGEEGWVAGEELEEEYAKGPEVGGFAVPDGSDLQGGRGLGGEGGEGGRRDADDFGSEVLGRATEGVRPIRDVLCEADCFALSASARAITSRKGKEQERTVGDLEVARRVNEQVLGLEVPIDDVLRVQVLERQDQVRRKEPRDVRREPARPPEVREELASLDVFEEEIQVPFVLKRAETSRVPVNSSVGAKGGKRGKEEGGPTG